MTPSPVTPLAQVSQHEPVHPSDAGRHNPASPDKRREPVHPPLDSKTPGLPSIRSPGVSYRSLTCAPRRAPNRFACVLAYAKPPNTPTAPQRSPNGILRHRQANRKRAVRTARAHRQSAPAARPHTPPAHNQLRAGGAHRLCAALARLVMH